MKMNRLIAGLAFSVVGHAVIQGQTLPNRPSLSLDEQTAWIVTTARVSRQLKLAPDQEKRVTGAFADLDASQEAIFAHGAPTSEQIDKLDHELASKVLEALNPSQRSRLHQIGIQLKGPFILDEPSFASQLGLSDQQKNRIHFIVGNAMKRSESFDEDLGKLFTSKPHATQAERNEIVASMASQKSALEKEKREDEQKILNLLTAGQKKSWKDLVGPKMP